MKVTIDFFQTPLLTLWKGELLYRPSEGETEKKSKPQGENANETESPAGRETYYTDYSTLRQERERGSKINPMI